MGTSSKLYGLDTHNRRKIVGNYRYVSGCCGKVSGNYEMYIGALHNDSWGVTVYR